MLYGRHQALFVGDDLLPAWAMKIDSGAAIATRFDPAKENVNQASETFFILASIADAEQAKDSNSVDLRLDQVAVGNVACDRSFVVRT